MTKDEVTKALRQAYNLGQIYWQQADSEYMSQHKKAEQTEAKFQELLETTVAALEAKDEPVGEVLNERGEVDYISYVPPVGTALYTTPPKQEAKDEPVAWMREDGTLHFADKNIFYVGQPFYTTPPQRTWVGLTNEEREQVINANTATGLWHMAKDIEAKLKEKNT